MHAPGHLRGAFVDWVDDGCPPTVSADGWNHSFFDQEPRTPQWLFGQLWNCSDIMPHDLCDQVRMDAGSTYGGVVQTMAREMNVVDQMIDQ